MRSDAADEGKERSTNERESCTMRLPLPWNGARAVVSPGSAAFTQDACASLAERNRLPSPALHATCRRSSLHLSAGPSGPVTARMQAVDRRGLEPFDHRHER